MLLWQPNVIYETTLSLYFEAHNVSIAGAAGGKQITGLADKPLIYAGLLKYSTRMKGDGTPDQGRAVRHYERAEMRKDNADTNVTINGFSIAERLSHVFKKYPGEGNDYEITKSGPLMDTIVIRPKKELVGDMVDELKPIFETIPALRNRAFILSWRSATQARNAALNVAIPDANGNESQTEQPPEIVSDVIRREASLLYNAVLGDKPRKAGEMWTLNGAILGGLIYPTLKSAFDGQIVVRAEELVQETPPLDRYAGVKTGDALDASAHGHFNGIRLVFFPAGEIEGQRVVSNLHYRTETADGGQREIRVDFSDPKKVIGDMYVDTDHQMIRHAYLKVSDADYTGSIPKFGSITVNAKVKGGVILTMQYDCVPVNVHP